MQRASSSKVPTSAESEVRSYRDVASAGLQSAGQVNSDGFKIVRHKKKSTKVTPAAATVNQRRKPLIGVLNCTSLPIVSKKERSKALFVSHFRLRLRLLM
jgi:hypothetical protein